MRQKKKEQTDPEDLRIDGLKELLLQKLERTLNASDEEILSMIDEVLIEAGHERYLRLSQRDRIRRELFNSIRRLDILQELLDDNTVTEIMVNGTDGIFIEQAGALQKWQKSFQDPEKIKDIV